MYRVRYSRRDGIRDSMESNSLDLLAKSLAKREIESIESVEVSK